MQKPTLSIKNKTKILVTLTIIALVISVSFGFEKVDLSERGYYLLHVINVIFGLFLSIVGIMAYLEFKNTRLLMVFAAFLAITVAESASLVNLVSPMFETTYGIHNLITHGLILTMLSFFIIGIFRSD